MPDKLAEVAPPATETQIEAASEANRKYGRVTHDNKHILEGSLGEMILDTEEELVKTRKENEKLLDRAMIDQVTGLPNEKALEDMIQGLEARWSRNGLWGTFIVADLTGLHDINDTYGRLAGGDDYLRAVGQSFSGGSRQGDRYFRMGTAADEFVLYLPGVSGRKAVGEVLDRVDGELRTSQEGYQTKYPGIKFELSYSISSYGGGVSPREALRKATNSLGDAKKSKNGERAGTLGRIFVK